MVRRGNDDGVDVFGIEQSLIATCGANRLADNFLRQFVASVIKISSSHTFDTGKLDGSGEQAGSFHAYAHDAEANLIAGRYGLAGSERRLLKQCGAANERGPRDTRG